MQSPCSALGACASNGGLGSTNPPETQRKPSAIAVVVLEHVFWARVVSHQDPSGTTTRVGAFWTIQRVASLLRGVA
jgi:hypothetical protein